MKVLSLLIALALVSTSAMAQDAIAPTTPSNFLSIVLGAATLILTTIIVPLAVLYGQGLLAERRLKNAQLSEQLRATIDSGAQKALGGALGKINIPEGKLQGPLKASVVAEAAGALAKNYSDTFADLGNMDPLKKATEIVESRIGMMDAQAAGNPVPNPSQPLAAPATQSVTVSPAKK